MFNVEPVRGMHWDADYKLRYTTYKLNISILTCGSANFMHPNKAQISVQIQQV